MFTFPCCPSQLRGDPNQPLAPELYAALKRVFGQVKVAKRGELAEITTLRGLKGEETRFSSWGEIYKWSCVYCGDTRFRAWASYMWGQPDPLTGRPMTHLLNCWNENCFKEFGRRRDFSLMLCGFMPPPKGRLFAAPDESRGIKRHHGPVTMPGLMAPLADLDVRHQAVRYMTGRGFDAKQLGLEYGLAYCMEADDPYPAALNRIVAPIYAGGKFVGWQARRLDESKKMKYYFSPDFPASSHLYNWDAASQQRIIVLVEGIFDVFSVGLCGAATFGKGLKDGQFQLLCAAAPKEPVVVLFVDHHTEEKTAEALAKLGPAFPGRVLVVHPPLSPAREDCRRWPREEYDAGDLTTDTVWRLIREEAARQEISLEL